MGLIGVYGETEAGDLEITILIEKEILRLDIKVEDDAGMAESHDWDEMLEIFPCSVLVKPTLGDTREELTAMDQLHDEVDLSLGSHDLMDMNDIGVVDAAEDGKREKKGEEGEKDDDDMASTWTKELQVAELAWWWLAQT